MRPTLAVIDIDIFSGQDELAREQLLENLETFRRPAVTPLWLNWLRERADLPRGLPGARPGTTR